MSFTNYLHKLVFPLIILLLAYLPLAGQTPYVFRHLKVENGLSNNNVKTILKDCEGFLWIGTANGLNRYDGYSFKVYQPKEKDIHSLLSNDIWNLHKLYLQPIITQYFIDNKSEIWLLFLIAHSKR